MGHDQVVMAQLIASDDVDCTGEDEKEAAANLADLGQRLASGKAADLSEAQQTLDLYLVELGKDLVVAESRMEGLVRAGMDSP
jgi:hypothetical protein